MTASASSARSDPSARRAAPVTPRPTWPPSARRGWRSTIARSNITARLTAVLAFLVGGVVSPRRATTPHHVPEIFNARANWFLGSGVLHRACSAHASGSPELQRRGPALSTSSIPLCRPAGLHRLAGRPLCAACSTSSPGHHLGAWVGVVRILWPSWAKAPHRPGDLLAALAGACAGHRCLRRHGRATGDHASMLNWIAYWWATRVGQGVPLQNASTSRCRSRTTAPRRDVTGSGGSALQGCNRLLPAIAALVLRVTLNARRSLRGARGWVPPRRRATAVLVPAQLLLHMAPASSLRWRRARTSRCSSSSG